MSAFLPRKSSRRGSAYILVMGALSVIFILSFSYINSMLDEFFQSHYHGDSVAAYYAAEAGVERAIFEFKILFEKPLLHEDMSVNQELLQIIDFNRAQDFTRNWSDRLSTDGAYHVAVEFNHLRRTPFYGFLYEKGLPPELEQFYKDTKNYNNPSRLGGWQGQLKITSTGTFKNNSRTVVVIKDIKIMDLTPPASEYTLFVAGNGTDFLRRGVFLLDHGMSHLVEIASGFLDDFDRLKLYLTEGNLVDLIEIVKDFVNKTKFVKPKEKGMPEIFATYRVAGRVRVNGTLHVWLPFFEVDDVISYFVRNIYYEKPAVGFPGCNNRLHDRFMSWATKFEGDIRKHYHELAPYVIQNQKPVPKVEQYTRWSTFPNFVKENPDEREPDRLVAIRKSAEQYACNVINRNAVMTGTQTAPFVLDGITYVKGDLTVGGYYTGKGMLVCTGNVRFLASVKHADQHTLLSIVSLGGQGIVAKDAQLEVNAGLYLHKSVKGGAAMKVIGNFVCNELNRQKGELGDLLMPEVFKVKYDKKIRQIRGDNFWVSISQRDITRIETGGR